MASRAAMPGCDRPAAGSRPSRSACSCGSNGGCDGLWDVTHYSMGVALPTYHT